MFEYTDRDPEDVTEVTAAQRGLHLVGEPAGRYASFDRLDDAAGEVCEIPVDRLDEPDVRRELDRLQTVTHRLAARQTMLAGALATKAEERAAWQHPNDPKAPGRAREAARDELVNGLQWTHSQAKQAMHTAQQLNAAADPAVNDAFEAGGLSPAHARVLGDTLAALTGQVTDQVRDLIRDQLLAVAGQQHAVAFGKTARTLLAQACHDSAVQLLERLKRSRYGRAALDPDGMYRLSAGLAGLDAEIAATALAAYRRPDLPDEARTPEQRTADALAAALQASLDHLEATSARRARPHVNVLITWEQLCNAAGVAHTTWTGPVPAAEIRRLLDDATISRIVTGPDSLPIDTGRASRTISPGIWRAVVARDRHCTFSGCDVPATWCVGAHTGVRWTDGAGISTDEIALACHAHHTYLDRNHWNARITNGTVHWHPPDHDGTHDGTKTGRTELELARDGPAP